MDKSSIKDNNNTHSRLKKIVSLFILFIGILLTISLVSNINTILSANHRIQEASNKLAILEGRNQELQRKVENANTSFFQEKQARDQLGLAREGEAVVILPEGDIVKRLSPIIIEKELDVLPDPVWKMWYKLFF